LRSEGFLGLRDVSKSGSYGPILQLCKTQDFDTNWLCSNKGELSKKMKDSGLKTILLFVNFQISWNLRTQISSASVTANEGIYCKFASNTETGFSTKYIFAFFCNFSTPYNHEKLSKKITSSCSTNRTLVSALSASLQK
jgi:hypothetical protein